MGVIVGVRLSDGDAVYDTDIVRESDVDAAAVSDGDAVMDGEAVGTKEGDADEVVVKPFEGDFVMDTVFVGLHCNTQQRVNAWRKQAKLNVRWLAWSSVKREATDATVLNFSSENSQT